MKKDSIWEKLRYRFDNFMSKGTSSLLLILAVITTGVVVAGGLLAVFLGGADGSGAESTGRSIWFTLMHAINTGVLAKEEGTVPYLAVMTVVTLVGIFITSFLIGTISNGIKDKMMSLQRGKSRVIENDHTVIIGFDDNIYSIIEELVLANENQKDAVIVVMSEEDKIRMEESISDQIPHMGNVRVVCRTGKPDSMSDLAICSLETCKSVIVNIKDDFMTVKTLLLCNNLLKKCGNNDARIIATVSDREVIQPALIAGGERAEILNFQKTIARLMVQSGRHPGMSAVLSELLSFDGNEIYVEDNPALIGFTLEEINLRMPDCVAIGLVRENTPMINCDGKTVFKEGDKLIRIALDDNPMVIKEPAVINEKVFASGQNEDEDPQNLLILGYSDMIWQILVEEDGYAFPGSKVTLAVEPGKIDESLLPAQDQLVNVTLDVQICNIFKRSTLEKLVDENPSSIMLMKDITIKEEEADARTLMLQLHLSDIMAERGVQIPMTIEMNSVHNQRLSQMMHPADYVVSSSITSKMMVQIAEQHHLKTILESLISDEGANIYMKPINHYITTGKEVDYYTLVAAAARFGEIAIGYKKYKEDGSYAIVVNPLDREAKKFGGRDDLIVVANG